MANEEMPIGKTQTIKAAKWLKQHFLLQMQAAVKGTIFDVEDLIAIACQETAYKWLLWIDKYTPDIVLARCIFDATGDTASTIGDRSAYPSNLTIFKKDYPILAKNLIIEGNKQRAMPQQGAPNGWPQSQMILYKGYGIYQYDLQFVKTDAGFFSDKLWYSIESCLQRLISELVKVQARWKKSGAVGADLKWLCYKGYNGSGQRAINYANNVTAFKKIILSV